MGNTAKQCRLGLFQDSDFAGDLEDSKSTSGGTHCVFGSRTFVPIHFHRKLKQLFFFILGGRGGGNFLLQLQFLAPVELFFKQLKGYSS